MLEAHITPSSMFVFPTPPPLFSSWSLLLVAFSTSLPPIEYMFTRLVYFWILFQSSTRSHLCLFRLVTSITNN